MPVILAPAGQPSAGHSGQGRLTGIYKDGQRIIALDSLLTQPKNKIQSFTRNAGGLFTSEAMPVPRQRGDIQSGLLRAIRRYRDLVLRQANAADQIDRSQTITGELLALRDTLAALYEPAAQVLTVIRAELNGAGLPNEKLIQTEVATPQKLSIDSLIVLLDAVADLTELQGAESEIANATEYLRTHDFRAEPPVRLSEVQIEPYEPEDLWVVRGDPAPAGYGDAPSSSGQIDPADIQPTIDVQFTVGIEALAAELGHSPAKMYEYVHNNYTFEPYLGSRKGSQQTLEHRRGNDYDQASLLIALLRVSGVPARYVSGTVEIPFNRASNWLGVDDPTTLNSMLNTAGFNSVRVVDSAGQTVAIRCKRVWVEAYVPFVNYRGAINDSTGQMWVPLDPAFKQYAYDSSINLLEEIDFNGELFVGQYYSTFHTETPLDLFRQMLLDSLAIYHPGATYDDLIRSRNVLAETDGILPATLPYTALTVDSSFSAIASTMRYRVRFRVWYDNPAVTFLDYTISLPEIVGKQITITHVAGSPADQDSIDAAGGIHFLPRPYNVDVFPVLRIDGCEVARSPWKLNIGFYIYDDMQFLAPTGAPNGAPWSINYIISGNTQGIGLDTEDAIPDLFGLPTTSCPEERLGEVLHQTALHFLNREDKATDEIAALFHQVLVNDVGLTIAESGISGDIPYSFAWKGLIIDVGRSVTSQFPVTGVSANCDFRWLRGANASILENQTLEQLFGKEAISAVKILEVSSDLGIGICRIRTTIEADCPDFNIPQVEGYVNGALSQGLQVIIPEEAISTTDNYWEGTGWITVDTVNCRLGDLITGRYNGAWTIAQWDSLPDEECLEPSGTISISPSSPNGLYCANSSDHFTFTVPEVKHWGYDEAGGCELIRTESDKEYTLNDFSISDIAGQWGAGTYEFVVGSEDDPHDCGCTILDTQITIVDVAIDAPTRPNQCNGLPPHTNATINVTITPDITGMGVISFDVINGSATNGTATIVENQIRSSSGTVTLRGENQTAVGGGAQLWVRARIDGTGVACATSEPFSVCAHPASFRQIGAGADIGSGVLHFDYAWESDCGHLTHLDEVEIGEFVVYPNAGILPDPPFENWLFDSPSYFIEVARTGFGSDEHTNNRLGWCLNAGPAATHVGTQYYRYRCKRCVPAGASEDPAQLVWGSILLGPLDIKRSVTESSGEWQYTVEKSGSTASRNPLPICDP